MKTEKLTTPDDYEGYGLIISIKLLESYNRQIDSCLAPDFCISKDENIQEARKVKMCLIQHVMDGASLELIPDYYKEVYKLSIIEILEKEVPCGYNDPTETNELYESKHELLNAVLQHLDVYRTGLEYWADSIERLRKADNNIELANSWIKSRIEAMTSFKCSLFENVVSGSFTNNIPEYYVPLMKQELIRIFEIK